MKLKIEVTKDDIERGIPDDCENCPVALALRRAVPDGVAVEVSHPGIRIGKAWFNLDAVREFTTTFDGGQDCPVCDGHGTVASDAQFGGGVDCSNCDGIGSVRNLVPPFAFELEIDPDDFSVA